MEVCVPDLILSNPCDLPDKPGSASSEDRGGGMPAMAAPRPNSHGALSLPSGSSSLHSSVSAQEQIGLVESVERTYLGKRPVDHDDGEDETQPLNGGYLDSQSNGAIQHSPPPKTNGASPRIEPLRDPRDVASLSLVKSPPSNPNASSPPIDFDGLSWPGLGTQDRSNSTPEEDLARQKKLEGAVKTILECIGEDPGREGLRDTPERYAKAMLFFTKGYEENMRDLINGAVFHEDHSNLVVIKDIDVSSLCEHHMVPFIGKMHIGYIPDGMVLGLSKFARLASMFSHRLQVQERLTKQVALAIVEVLKPHGVGIVMESSHLCMMMRGVEKPRSSTITSCMLGTMQSSDSTRHEFLSHLNK